MKTIDQLDPAGKKVLVRVDFNVPVAAGVLTDDTRIRAALPTIKALQEKNARIILMSHRGRPSGCGFEEDFSLKPVVEVLSQLIGSPVHYANDIIGPDAQSKASALKDKEILIIENLRFDKREKKNDPEFARELASLGEIYVNDAFGTAHRAHASTVGVADYLPAYAGYLIEKEVKTLKDSVDNPRRPFCAIIGGAKISDKIKVIDSLLDKCDTLIIGGGMCFTFLASKGLSVGTSLKEDDWIERAGQMIEKAKDRGVDLLLPKDIVCADKFSNDAKTQIASVQSIPDDMMGLDIGPETSAYYGEAIKGAETIFWNGPMGVFEMEKFMHGTKDVAIAVAENDHATSIIGGGDSVAAINKFDLASRVSFISTGGGASMELVEGKELPGITALL